MIQGLADDYKDTKPMMYRDPSLNIEHSQITTRDLYLDDPSRWNTNDSKLAGRDAAMAVGPTTGPNLLNVRCCHKPGHYQRGCALFTKDNISNKPAFKGGTAGPEGAAGKK